MKLLHCSDLHLGKKLFGYSLIEEQKDMMEKLMDYAIQNGVSAILIAGDLYDQPVAPFEAMSIFERFLIRARDHGIRVFCIGGNHDSNDRLEYNSIFLDESNLIIRSHFNGEIPYFDLQNEDGKDIRIHLLPFVRPYDVQPFFEQPLDSYQQAYEAAISLSELKPEGINILVAHQFISGGSSSDSEVRQIGGLDQISPDCLNVFDYCALGHLHRSQKVGENVHYPGTLLRFGKDETGPEKDKSFLVLDIGDEIKMEKVKFQPLHDLIHLKGTFEDLVKQALSGDLDAQDYYWISLEDEKPIPEIQNKLKNYFPRMVQFEYENQGPLESDNHLKAFKSEDPLEMISTFYKDRSGMDLNSSQHKWVQKIWEELHETD